MYIISLQDFIVVVILLLCGVIVSYIPLGETSLVLCGLWATYTLTLEVEMLLLEKEVLSHKRIPKMAPIEGDGERRL